MLNIEYKILEIDTEVVDSLNDPTPLYIYGWFNLTDSSGLNLNNYDFDNIDDYLFSITGTDNLYEWFLDLSFMTYDLLNFKATKLVRCYNIDEIMPRKALILERKGNFLQTYNIHYNDDNYLRASYETELPESYKIIRENELVPFNKWVDELYNKSSNFIEDIIRIESSASNNSRIKDLLDVCNILRSSAESIEHLK